MAINPVPNKKPNPIFRAFRKYHRLLAIILCLPLLISVLTGMGYTILVEWFKVEDAAELLLGLHTMEIVHLDKIFPVLNGLGLVGLLVTGMTMTGLFKKRPNTKPNSET
ncbi:MAG: peptidase [Microcystaceae cyanobacterium]